MASILSKFLFCQTKTKNKVYNENTLKAHSKYLMNPIIEVLKTKKTINNRLKNTTISTKGRHDPCVGLRAVPIAEAMTACVLADHIMRNKAQCG